jgi:hypothetical protein
MRFPSFQFGWAASLVAAHLCSGCSPACVGFAQPLLEHTVPAPVPVSERVLLVVAHQDDDAFIESRIRRHLRSGDSVYVVWTSYSDRPDSAYGNARLGEAALAMKYLGIPEQHYFFLGYPDGGTHLYLRQIISRLCDLIGRIHPTTVYVPAFECGHIDHDIAHVATVLALGNKQSTCRLKEFPIYSALDVLPLFPFRFRALPSLRGTACRTLSDDEYNDVLRYWGIYKSQQFPIDWYMCITDGHEKTFGIEYLRDVPAYNYLCEPDDGPVAYERFLPGVTFSDFTSAVKNARPDRMGTAGERVVQPHPPITGGTGSTDAAKKNTTASLGTKATNSLADQRDVFDVLDMLFNLNISSSDTSVKEKGKLYVAAIPAVGYSLNTKFAVTIGANAALYTDDIDSVNLSTFNFNPTYTFKHQIMLPVQSNVWTSGNEYNFLGNWIYYRYPEVTYGLGGHTSESAIQQLDYRFLLFRETVLKRVSADLYAGIGYDLDSHWDITDGGLAGGGISDFQRYGRTTRSVSSGVTLDLMYDGRQNPINPHNGYYASVVYRDNATFLGSDGNWQSLLLDLRSYFKVPADSRNVLAFWSYNWFVLRGTPPYLDLPASSWDTYANQGRGYIQSRFRGKDLIAIESEYRFGITDNGLFGGVVFGNVQSVSDWPGNAFTVLHPGAGFGIRFKMNKFSDTNVAIDYGFGLGGSGGVFVNLGEVF